jgi:hypothetical protein
VPAAPRPWFPYLNDCQEYEEKQKERNDKIKIKIKKREENNKKNLKNENPDKYELFYGKK